jgi:hypothetical protein
MIIWCGKEIPFLSIFSTDDMSNLLSHIPNIICVSAPASGGLRGIILCFMPPAVINTYKKFFLTCIEPINYQSYVFVIKFTNLIAHGQFRYVRGIKSQWGSHLYVYERYLPLLKYTFFLRDNFPNQRNNCS